VDGRISSITFILLWGYVSSMPVGTVNSFEECVECGKEFKRMEISDPRKGYDVLWEYTEKWEIQCKGCGTALEVPK
jgi:DNA-directed RNA polymerase subunit RPC12/RpoP